MAMIHGDTVSNTTTCKAPAAEEESGKKFHGSSCNGFQNHAPIHPARTQQQQQHKITQEDYPLEDIPWILQCWSSLSSNLPFRVSLPIGPHGTHVDFSVTVASVLLLGMLNVLASDFLIQRLGFPPSTKMTQWTTGSVVAIFHSSNLTAALLSLFWTRMYHVTEPMHTAPQWWQQASHAVFQFCTGYMIYDAIAILCMHGEWTSSDSIFLAHHVIVAFFTISPRLVGAGQSAVLMLMLMGECTNPFHNVYYILENCQSIGQCQHLDWLHSINTVVFCISYIIVRGIMGPIVFSHMSIELVRNYQKSSIPTGLVCAWILLKWFVGLGSLPWVADCWDMLQPFLDSASSTTSEL